MSNYCMHLKPFFKGTLYQHFKLVTRKSNKVTGNKEKYSFRPQRNSGKEDANLSTGVLSFTMNYIFLYCF